MIGSAASYSAGVGDASSTPFLFLFGLSAFCCRSGAGERPAAGAPCGATSGCPSAALPRPRLRSSDGPERIGESACGEGAVVGAGVEAEGAGAFMPFGVLLPRRLRSRTVSAGAEISLGDAAAVGSLFLPRHRAGAADGAASCGDVASDAAPASGAGICRASPSAFGGRVCNPAAGSKTRPP